MAALGIESFPCNHSINVVLTGFNSIRQRIQVKFKTKVVNLWFYKIILNLLHQTLSNMLWFYENDFLLNVAFFGIYEENRHIFKKMKRCFLPLEQLSIVCAKLEPASSKNNEILEVNVLQTFTSHVLLCTKPSKTHLINTRYSEIFYKTGICILTDINCPFLLFFPVSAVIKATNYMDLINLHAKTVP